MEDEGDGGRFETESAMGSGSVFISDRAYRRLVAAVLNSPPDKRVGCQPYQLLDHLRNVPSTIFVSPCYIEVLFSGI